MNQNIGSSNASANCFLASSILSYSDGNDPLALSFSIGWWNIYEIAFIISIALVGLFGFHIFLVNKGIHNDPSNY